MSQFVSNVLAYLQEINGLTVVINNFDFLIAGLVLTVQITVMGITFGMIIGLITALFKLSTFKLLNFIAAIYIDFFRGTPFFVQIMLLYFGILPSGIDPVTAGIIACSLNSGAYIAEIVRAGIQAVDKGQLEAAYSLGMNYPQAMWYIILPQAYKIVIPPLINECIMLLKDTSLLSIIGVLELTKRGTIVFSTTFEATWIWGVVSIMYLIMTKTLAVVGDKVERRLAT